MKTGSETLRLMHYLLQEMIRYLYFFGKDLVIWTLQCFQALEVPVTDNSPSDVPGEAFVSAARNSAQVAKTALRVFKEKAMIFPKPIRQYLWEEFIYVTKASDHGSHKPKVG